MGHIVDDASLCGEHFMKQYHLVKPLHAKKQSKVQITLTNQGDAVEGKSRRQHTDLYHVPNTFRLPVLTAEGKIFRWKFLEEKQELLLTTLHLVKTKMKLQQYLAHSSLTLRLISSTKC